MYPRLLVFPLTLLLIAFALGACRQQESSDDSISIGKVEEIYSQVLKQKRTVWVHVPDGEPRSARFPVLYLMDGDAHFKSVVGLMHQLSSVNGNITCPKMIIVAILNRDRLWDLTPTPTEANELQDSTRKTGGGELFTSFIADELIPYIDKNYPTTKERTLVGHSLGGLMVINTMIKHTELFDKYLAIDPSLWWNDMRSLREYEKALANNNLKGRSLFLAIANTIRTDTLTALGDTAEATGHYRALHHFVQTLRQTKSNELDWRSKYYEEETHGSVPLIAEYDAFNFLYRRIPIHMDLSALQGFAGTYEHSFRKGETVQLHIVANSSGLTVTESWRNVPMDFLPVGENDFYNNADRFPIEFHKDNDGDVFELVAFGQDVWKKVE